VLILVFVALGLLALGVLIGGIAGGIITGDWRYTITSAVAMSVLALCLVVVVTTILMRATRGADRPISRAPHAAQITVAMVIVVAASAVTLIPSAGSISRIGTNQNFLTGAYQQQAVDAIGRVVGSHELVDIDFYDSYVIAQAPTKPGADTTDNYQYRYGHAERLGPEPDSASDTRTAEYDSRMVDFALIPKLVRDAERRTKTRSPTSLHVLVMQPLDTRTGQEPTINIEVDNAYHSNQLHYSPRGRFIDGVGDAFKDS
jgi:hypothetical protein